MYKYYLLLFDFMFGENIIVAECEEYKRNGGTKYNRQTDHKKGAWGMKKQPDFLLPVT